MSWCFLGYSSCKDWLDLELYAAPGFFWVFERIEMAVSCRDGRRLFQVEDKIDVDLMPASLTLFWLETWILAICIRITMLWLVHAWLTGCYNHWCLYFMDKCSYQPKPCSVQLQVNTWSFLNNGWNVWSWRHNFQGIPLGLCAQTGHRGFGEGAKFHSVPHFRHFLFLVGQEFLNLSEQICDLCR